jgi:hypothetical protein
MLFPLLGDPLGPVAFIGGTVCSNPFTVLSSRHFLWYPPHVSINQLLFPQCDMVPTVHRSRINYSYLQTPSSPKLLLLPLQVVLVALVLILCAIPSSNNFASSCNIGLPSPDSMRQKGWWWWWQCQHFPLHTGISSRCTVFSPVLVISDIYARSQQTVSAEITLCSHTAYIIVTHPYCTQVTVAMFSQGLSSLFSLAASLVFWLPPVSPLAKNGAQALLEWPITT